MHLERIESGRKYLVAGLYNKDQHSSSSPYNFSLRALLLAFAVGIVLGSMLTSSFLVADSSSSSSTTTTAKKYEGDGGGMSPLQQQQQQQQRDRFKRFFPQFHPLAKVPLSVKRVGPDTMWANVEERKVAPFFSSSSHHHHRRRKQKQQQPPPLTWLWINVRPHINILPALTAGEVQAIFSRGGGGGGVVGAHNNKNDGEAQQGEIDSSLRKILSFRAEQVVEVHRHQQQHDDSQPQNNLLLFPVFLQTKYSYRGDSIAIVGGLFDPASDRSLRQTAIRELREELGVQCTNVVSHGRFVVDANRGCGNFESFYATNCEPVPLSVHDVAEKDVEPQKLLLVTREDLEEILANTRKLGARSEMPVEVTRLVVSTSSSNNNNNNKKREHEQSEEEYDLNEKFDGNPPGQNDYDEDFDDNHYEVNRKLMKLDRRSSQHDGGGADQKHEKGVEEAASSNNFRSMRKHVLKETKWIATISMTLLALERG